MEKERESKGETGAKKEEADSVSIPREDNHHGVEVNGAVCNSLQDILFICNRKLLVTC